jgi:hypothetical protein
MNHRGYTILGWLVWQIGTRVVKHNMLKTRSKLAAGVAVAAGVAAAGIALASGDDD